MAKKRLDITDIQNDLQRSSFFPAAPAPAPALSSPTTPPPATPAPLTSIPDPIALEDRLPLPTPLSSTERSTRTVEPNGRTVESEQTSSLLDEISQGVKTDRRPTERYSFEIYTDQIPQIEELQYLYKKRTGQKLPASRILREALEAYLHNAFEAMKRKK